MSLCTTVVNLVSIFLLQTFFASSLTISQNVKILCRCYRKSFISLIFARKLTLILVATGQVDAVIHGMQNISLSSRFGMPVSQTLHILLTSSTVSAKYQPYDALRQRFRCQYLTQYAVRMEGGRGLLSLSLLILADPFIARHLLKSLSIKQGMKYDAPESVNEILQPPESFSFHSPVFATFSAFLNL
jgi:hypothetical protein